MIPVRKKYPNFIPFNKKKRRGRLTWGRKKRRGRLTARRMWISSLEDNIGGMGKVEAARGRERKTGGR